MPCTAPWVMTMYCNTCRTHLFAYVHGELPGARRMAVARHLEQCPACRAEAARIHTSMAALRVSPTPLTPPPEMARAVVVAIAHRPSRRAAYWPRFCWGVAAVSLLVGAFALGNVLTQTAPPTNVVVSAPSMTIPAPLETPKAPSVVSTPAVVPATAIPAPPVKRTAPSVNPIEAADVACSTMTKPAAATPPSPVAEVCAPLPTPSMPEQPLVAIVPALPDDAPTATASVSDEAPAVDCAPKPEEFPIYVAYVVDTARKTPPRVPSLPLPSATIMFVPEHTATYTHLWRSDMDVIRM